MIPKVSFPIVVMGAIANGCAEHPAIINRVWEHGDTADGPVRVAATMFPDGGGEAQYQASLHVYESREAAEDSKLNHRKAYWAAHS